MAGVRIATVAGEASGDLLGAHLVGALSERRDGLWQSTCVELFVGPAEEAGYWEVNLSPSGAWNVYAFTGYRQAMAPAPATLESPQCTGNSEAGILDLGFVLPLPASWTDQPLVAALTAVVEGAHIGRSYWALCHPSPTPDFHDRAGFVLRL